MKILYITTFYEQRSVSAAIRNSAWVDGLISAGCEVTVMTVDWPQDLKSSFLMFNNRAKVIRTRLNELEILKTTTRQIKKMAFSKLTPLRHFLRDLIYFPDICKRWPHCVDIPKDIEYDMLISSSDFKTSHYVAWKFKKKFPELLWIQIWGDPWKDDVGLNWLNKKRAAKRERELLAIADRVVYVSPITKNVMCKRFNNLEKKTFYIPRGFYKSVTKTKKVNQIIQITYTGGLSLRNRNVINLLKIVEEFSKNVPLNLHFNFYGHFDAETENQFRHYHCCSIFSAVDYEEILTIYKNSDALLFVSNKGNSSQIPGKFFDYMGTNLPIICLVDSFDTEVAKMLKTSPRCLIIENSEDGIKKKIGQIPDFVKQKFEVETKYSPQNIALQLLSII